MFLILIFYEMLRICTINDQFQQKSFVKIFSPKEYRLVHLVQNSIKNLPTVDMLNYFHFWEKWRQKHFSRHICDKYFYNGGQPCYRHMTNLNISYNTSRNDTSFMDD